MVVFRSSGGTGVFLLVLKEKSGQRLLDDVTYAFLSGYGGESGGCWHHIERE